MTPEELIAETLRLDAEATKGPWVYTDHGDIERIESRTLEVCDFGCPGGWSGDLKGNAPRGMDMELILSYRTAAPRLARMLRAAIAGLTVVRDRIGITDQQDASCADATLAEIERIAKEETDGSQR